MAEPVIRTLIVDDELPGRMNLRYALQDFPAWQLLGECTSAAQAREMLAREAVDVLFLDIQMPKESGIDLARELSQQAAPPIIVFVTAFERFALDAFAVHALDYLLKPFDDVRLAQTLERAASMLALRRSGYRQALQHYVDSQAEQAASPYLRKISIRSIGQIELVDLDEVTWLAASGNYVQLHLAGRSVLHRCTLTQLESSLDPACFIRVHRSTVVRRNQLAKLSVTGDGTYALTLRCGAVVAVSERYVGTVRQALDS
ncbi:LytR/AlgR family response regulator transcription factor [Chitinimonas sp.]|uniref:LytR/AlgR family response regulator transcription factor n=1 Tax=Chitinimonas sp. TaxID=1934313 RepID=UPI0035AEBED2